MKKEKKIIHTVNFNDQHHPTIPVSPSDTATGNFKRSQLTHQLDTILKKVQTAQEGGKKAQTAKGSDGLTVDHTKNSR